MKTASAALAALLLLACTSGTAFAHKVSVYAYAENGRVYTESYFSDGTKCVNSKVEVFDSAGKKLAEGGTDANGAFSFPITKADDLRIVLNASMGHKAEYRLKKSEVDAAAPGANAGKKVPVEKQGAGPAAGHASKKPVQPPKPEASCPDTDRFREVVGEEVDVRVKPLYQMVADLRRAQERPRLGEIAGGIGYIVGLMGIYLYARSRRQ